MYYKIEKGFYKFQNFLLGVIGICLAVMVTIIILQTVTRYIIFHSLPWSEELSRYLFVFIIMIGLNIAIRDDMLISIDILDRFVGNTASGMILQIFRHILALIVSIIISYNCQKLFFIGSIQKSPAMAIPMITMYGTIFAGYILSAISLVFKIITTTKSLIGQNSDKRG